MNDDSLNARLLPTRQSLLSRLRSWNDQDSWRQFFDTYWRLIFDVARKAGLSEAAAQDVVQETIVTVAKQMPDFRYDRAQGTFKGWLMQITRRRIADQLRRQYRHGETGASEPAEADGLPALAEISNDWEVIWDAEWRTHLTATATARVKRQVMPQQFQIFELNVLHGWPARKVAAMLEVTLMQVYLAKHRVGAVFRKEFKALENQGG